MPNPTVEISQSGRGGSIYYREGDNTITFGWEFALPPALALIFGTEAKHWEHQHPWVAGRQKEIFELVAEEVIRQKAPGSDFESEPDTGSLTILMAAFAKRTGANKRAKASIAASRKQRDDTYDLEAIAGMTLREQKQLVETLTKRGEVNWRDVQALEAIDTPEARAAIDEASKDHLSIDTRLAAAEVMYKQGRLPDLDTFLARQIRQLSQPANGLQRALELARRNPSEKVKQALLWASYNTTECAPHCAGLLLTLMVVAKVPFDDKLKPMLQKLDLHNSYFDRKAAFDELCRLVKMELDTSQSD